MHILILDDDPHCAALLQRSLRRLGHHTALAAQPDLALQLLDDVGAGVVDAIITDLEMPGMDGVSFARAVRQRGLALPIGFCTGADRHGARTREACAIGPLLEKPFDGYLLAQLVEQLHLLRFGLPAPPADES